MVKFDKGWEGCMFIEIGDIQQFQIDIINKVGNFCDFSDMPTLLEIIENAEILCREEFVGAFIDRIHTDESDFSGAYNNKRRDDNKEWANEIFDALIDTIYTPFIKLEMTEEGLTQEMSEEKLIIVALLGE